MTDQVALSGNGSIGMEIVESLSDVDVVHTPYGGGSMTTGVANAVKALRPLMKVFAVKEGNAVPVMAALAAGRIVDIERDLLYIIKHRRNRQGRP